MNACHQCGAPLDAGDRFCRSCGGVVTEAQSRDPLIGRTIGGAYVVLEMVGVGGMGRVYRAEQTMLGRTVAIKVVHPHLLGDEQSVARFYSEARTASRLNHPNSVGVIDFGRTEDGILYLVMEFLRGRDLARVMHEEGPLPFQRIVEILLGALAALGEAHALAIVHRDLKPENIVIERQRTGEVVKVVDFGLAKIVGGARATSITSPGLVCGTPDYMSPEQGRGEDVDNRGDLYAIGVLLFELLTDRLPFTDDTPAKVVLRHMTEPVPDPRLAAPQRAIPDSLAVIAMKAMAKSAADRFQSADEMALALKAAVTPAKPKKPGEAACVQCGAMNPRTSRFCAECGARLPEITPTPRPSLAPRSDRPSLKLTLRPDRPMVGRARELGQLELLHRTVAAKTLRIEVIGESGVGKTCLLREFAGVAQRAGDVVALVGAHASGAPVPYGPIIDAVCALLVIDTAGLERLANDSGSFLDELARAGVEELIKPQGILGSEGRSRAGAVAAALAMAIRVGAGRAESARVVLIVDDLHRCDGLSRSVLGLLPHAAADTSLLVVSAGTRSVVPPGTENAHLVALRGLDYEAAGEMLTGVPAARSSIPAPPPSQPAQEGERLLLPLYLEQLRALGMSQGGDETLPPRLADAVAVRIDRLDLSARRLLQAIAVLGDRCARPALEAVAGAVDAKALEGLRKEGLVTVAEDGTVTIAHTFLREIVEASIPAEARNALHEKALHAETESGAPLEVRAEHAFRAGETMSALVLLERMGDGALQRGCPTTAILAFRRGLDLARREMLETGEVSLDRAIASFSRKLGDALDRAGDTTGADGVVREALDLCARESIDRARMLLVLARVAVRREKARDASRLLGEALDIGTQKVDPLIAAEAQSGLARIRRDEGDAIGAANALRRAVELFATGKAPLWRRAQVQSELGEVLVDVGDVEEATRALASAQDAAQSAPAPFIESQVLGTLGSLDEVAGRTDAAAQRYREASSLAARAGDADGRERWARAAATLGRVSKF